MKLILFFVAITICSYSAHTQSLPKRAEQKAKDKVGYKVDAGVDQGIDSAFSKTGRSISNLFKKKNKKNQGNSDRDQYSNETAEAGGTPNGSEGAQGSNPSDAARVTTNSDFVPGQKVLFEDNFEQDALNDFPAKWNTTGSGTVVTIDGTKGRWLSIPHNSLLNPEMDKALPENATIEFDLFLQSTGQGSIPYIIFGLTPVKNIMKEDVFRKDRFFFKIERYDEINGKTIEYGLKDNILGNKSQFAITDYVNKSIHVAIAINKTRMRIYLDDEKLIDLPKVLSPEMRNNFYFNNGYCIPASKVPMLISNFRVADADVDARSLLIKQLMETGKTSTTDILFDVNSDVLKQQSFAVINQFGEALVKNPTLKLKITGHTDSDGVDAANLTLSQKRAAAVKTYITENYAVAGSRIQTDGKGASQPVAPNTTADGKSKNRRVEFVKL